jgi:hypothetical protein
MRIVGARTDVDPVASDVLPGMTNYFLGDNPERWRAGVEGYARVRYPRVLPGVDLVFYGNDQEQLEYDVVLAPGADPNGVALAFEGVESTRLDAAGRAVLRAPGASDLILTSPAGYQIGPQGGKQTVDVRYQVSDKALRFAVGKYDRRRELVIDPGIVYATYLGGTGFENAYAIAADAAGEAVVVGSTNSVDFPTVSPAQGTIHNGQVHSNAFITKFDASGSALVYSTYLGGSGPPVCCFDDYATAVAVDAAGQAYVVGTTYATDFPTVAPYQATNRTVVTETATGWVAKLSATGSLVYSSYLGGNYNDFLEGVAVDAAGDIFVTGEALSLDFPTAAPLQGTNHGSGDAFLTKLNAAGSALVYSTFLGGAKADNATAIAVDAAGSAYLGGVTLSTDFPTASPFQATNHDLPVTCTRCIAPRGDVFVTKLTPDGSALVYSTYLGGGLGEGVSGLAIDAAGDVFVSGSTTSTDFPTAFPLQPAPLSGTTGFVTMFNPSGSALMFSTYLDGNTGTGIAVDPAGQAVVGGNGLLTKFNGAGSALLYSTSLGGTIAGVSMGPNALAFVAGTVSSASLSTVSPYQSAFAGGSDAFFAKVADPPSAPVPAMGRWTAALAALLVALGALLARGFAAPRSAVGRPSS